MLIVSEFWTSRKPILVPLLTFISTVNLGYRNTEQNTNGLKQNGIAIFFINEMTDNIGTLFRDSILYVVLFGISPEQRQFSGKKIA